jgi:hydrogenase expression/formation protein HypE
MSPVKPGYTRPLDLRHGRIDMSHGSGGRSMVQLIEQIFLSAFDNPALAARDDHAVLATPPELALGGQLVMATDSHVVSPLFFPGGDIGCLSVHGTVNDVAMAGARPLWLSAGFILEEGFPLADLQRIVTSMARAAAEAGVPIVTGDTKVVQAGKGDGVFINTTGVGVTRPGVHLSGSLARPGDAILVSGTMGDHGVAVMSVREGLSFGTTLLSDTQSLHTLVAAMLDAVPGIHVLRDPTRGGLGATLNEIASQSGVGMRLSGVRHSGARRSAGGLRIAGPGPPVCGQRRQAAGDLPGRPGRRLAGRHARPPAGARRRAHRQRGGRPQPFRADDHRAGRAAHGGLALGRTVAAHLLRAKGPTGPRRRSGRGAPSATAVAPTSSTSKGCSSSLIAATGR